MQTCAHCIVYSVLGPSESDCTEAKKSIARRKEMNGKKNKKWDLIEIENVQSASAAGNLTSV